MDFKVKPTAKQISIWEKSKAFLMKLGASLMLPIVILPLAGILIGLSSFFPDEALIGQIFSTVSFAIISALPLLFAISIALTFSNHQAWSAFLTLLVFAFFIIIETLFIKTNQNSTLSIFNIELPNYYFTVMFGATILNTSLFGGIIIGFITAVIFKQKRFSLYQKCFIAIGIGILLGLITLVIWPLIYFLLAKFLQLIIMIPFGFNAFFYGFFNRLLLPFGLHSLLIPLVTYSPLGGVLIKNGEIVAQGDSAIWLYLVDNHIPLQLAIDNSSAGTSFVYLGDVYYLSLNCVPGQYQEGFFPILIFGFPAAGAAMMLKTDDVKQRKLILIAALTPMLSGITEPFEYLFVFTNPLLYLCSAFLTGCSFGILSFLHVSVFLSSGWIFDVFLFGLAQNLIGQQTYWWIIFAVGPFFSIAYFSLFWFFYQPQQLVINNFIDNKSINSLKT